jgi:hypothetical protein
MAMTNMARPYTIDALRTKIFRRPVRSESLPPIRDADDDDGLGEGTEEDLLRYPGLGDADLVQQVVGQVRGQEGVGQHQHEAAGEGPGEVRAPARVHLERAGEFP